jgi:hypothetical protein
MIEFYTGYSCSMPLEVLTETEADMLSERGITRTDGGFNLNVAEFPGILYSKRTVPFHSISVPLYIQTLFGKPYFETMRRWNRYDTMRREETAMQQLRADIEEFPLEPFYEQLFQLQGILIEHDNKIKQYAQAMENRAVFGEYFSKNTWNSPFFYHTLLHELYHFVEFNHDDLQDYFTPNRRWRLTKRTLLDGRILHELEWKDENDTCSSPNELAEYLAALTLVKHPGIISELDPYYNKACEDVSRQLNLFKSSTAWYM